MGGAQALNSNPQAYWATLLAGRQRTLAGHQGMLADLHRVLRTPP